MTSLFSEIDPVFKSWLLEVFNKTCTIHTKPTNIVRHVLCATETIYIYILSNKRNAPVIYSDIIWNLNIRTICCDYIWTFQSITVVFRVVIEDFVIPLAIKITLKMGTPEFESNNICDDFSLRNKDGCFQCALWKIQIFLCNLFLACPWIQYVKESFVSD